MNINRLDSSTNNYSKPVFNGVNFSKQVRQQLGEEVATELNRTLTNLYGHSASFDIYNPEIHGEKYFYIKCSKNHSLAKGKNAETFWGKAINLIKRWSGDDYSIVDITDDTSDKIKKEKIFPGAALAYKKLFNL